MGFVPHLLVVGVLMLLCLKQPDFGSAVVLLFLTFTMLFVAGARVPYIAAFTMLLGLGAAGLIRFSSYRYARYLSWIDMEGHPHDLAYTVPSSDDSVGRHLRLGLGAPAGVYPRANRLLLSAIVGEEWLRGVVGSTAASWSCRPRQWKIALEARDDYSSFLAFGIATMFGVQAMTNLAVAMAILPTKGLTLPFLSYGGSSLLVNAAAIGILLNISRPRLDGAPEAENAKPEPPRNLPLGTGGAGW